jgi:uncharacterized protein
MPVVAEHSPGSPCWIDLSAADVAASLEFYRAMFGWEGIDTGPETGHYTICTLAGQQVAAIAPKMNDGPPAWSIYVCSSDLEITTAAVRAAGGTVVAEPMTVMTAGRMAIYVDATGAPFNAWQPGDNLGVGMMHEVGSWNWSELLTRDAEAAITFYDKVFGWGLRRHPVYEEWQLDGESIAGLVSMPDQVPAQVPAFWLPYLAVADVDAAVARATELGGAVRVPGADFDGGRYAVIEDPHGAGIGLLRM